MQEAADCIYAHFYLLPEAYGTPLGMELMEYGCYCEDKDKEDIDSREDCANCNSFKENGET